jgi:hypothetical protein
MTNGCVSLMARHVIQKRGIYWYQRRIPKNLLSFYPKSWRSIRKSLQTREAPAAASRAAVMASEDEAHWRSLRGGELQAAPETDAVARGMLRSLGLRPGQAGTTDKGSVYDQNMWIFQGRRGSRPTAGVP